MTFGAQIEIQILRLDDAKSKPDQTVNIKCKVTKTQLPIFFKNKQDGQYEMQTNKNTVTNIF